MKGGLEIIIVSRICFPFTAQYSHMLSSLCAQARLGKEVVMGLEQALLSPLF